MTTLAEIETIFRNVQATRYVSAAGLVILLWDHLLTFDDEIEYIWKGRWTLPKGLFLAIRYIVPAALLVHTYELSGLAQHRLSDTFCKGLTAVGIYVGVLSIALGNFLVLLRLWWLWNRDAKLVNWSMTFFVLTQLATIGITTHTAITGAPAIYFDENINMCSTSRKIELTAIWIPGIIYEVMVLLTTVMDALTKPRQKDGTLTRTLYRDGIGYFVCLTFLRVTNLTLSIVAPLSLTWLGMLFIWAGTTVAVTRLVLNSRKSEEDHAYEANFDASAPHAGRAPTPPLSHRGKASVDSEYSGGTRIYVYDVYEMR